MAQTYLHTTARSQKWIFNLIHEFNLRPARYIDQTWLDDLDDQLITRLTKSRRGERKLSDLILDRFQLRDHFFFDFEDKSERIALIDSATLHQLFFATGIALNHTYIRSIIEKSAQLQLKQSIGEASFTFGIKKAPLLIGNQGFPFILKPDPDDLKTSFTLAGLKCFSAVFSGGPRALTQRLKFKLPVLMALDFDMQISTDVKGRLGKVFQKVLLQEVNPSWVQLFT